MKNQVIIHIPHSSTNIPILDGYAVGEQFLEVEILKLTDWYTDDLFFSDEDRMVRADFSRIFCDPERFTNDSQEVMTQYGMGVLYEKSDGGEVMRIVTPELKEKVLNEYYRKHHRKFSDEVNNQLQLFGKTLIIDCHSYPGKPLMRDPDQTPNRPDFNIGTDTYHTPKLLIDLSIDFFRTKGYTLGIDRPYKGSIVPLEHYQKNRNVQTIMLEINRNLYLKEPTHEKSDQYAEIKNVTGEFIKALKNSL